MLKNNWFVMFAGKIDFSIENVDLYDLNLLQLIININ
jgi:hypothetical protein